MQEPPSPGVPRAKALKKKFFPFGPVPKGRHISRGHSLCANAVGFEIPGVFQLFIRCAKISFPRGGVYTF